MAKSTGSMNPAVKCITMTVCSRVLYCSYYAASPAINLSLLISNKSSLWWVSQMLEIWSLQHHTWREDSNTRTLPSFVPSLLVFLGDMVQPRTDQVYFAPTCSELEFYHPPSVRSSAVWPWQRQRVCRPDLFCSLANASLVWFLNVFVPDSSLESRIFKWTETRCAKVTMNRLLSRLLQTPVWF